jgi:asparagine synthase (glutamine-hydrolysing)
MAHSLEVRVPFLDHELVEFVARIPPGLRMKGGKLKYLLKKAMQGKIPEQIIKRRKSGWHIPLAEWFQLDLRDYVCDILSASKIAKSGFFNKDYIDALLKEHFKRRRNNSFKIWGLLVFSHWYDTFA